MKRYNFSNIIKGIEITLTIMVLLNFATAFYAINQLNRNSMDAVINRLSTDIDNISDNLSGIHSMMLAEVGYDKDLDTLLVADTQKTQIDQVTITVRIKGIISNWSKELTFPVHYALYFPGNGIVINDADNNDEYDQWRKVQYDIINRINTQDYKSDWNILSLGGEYYLVDIIGINQKCRLMSEMVERIKGLKIDIYEKTLEQQKTTMDFLTLQIEPHFYLNCLNIIYNMAQMEQYKEIQKLSNYVSEYLRYIFKSRETFATVKEELEHINKYLEIQKIRYGNCFEAHIMVEDRLLAVSIPPLILQTFVENALKYTINWEDDIELSLTGRMEGEEAIICIEDTGEGYEENILYKLQHGIDISEGERRIGIMNAISRMRLTYGNAASLRFYNRTDGGAGVEIRFPTTI